MNRDITALPKESRWHSLTNDDPLDALDELVAERDRYKQALEEIAAYPGASGAAPLLSSRARAALDDKEQT